MIMLPFKLQKKNVLKVFYVYRENTKTNFFILTLLLTVISYHIFNCLVQLLNLRRHLEVLTYQLLLTFLTDVCLTVFANILSEKKFRELVI